MVVGVIVLTAVASQQSAVLEPFEGPTAAWVVSSDVSGTGTITQSTTTVASGLGAARLAASSGSVAQIRSTFSDAASGHTWNERPGTYRWQRTSVYLPSAAIAALGANGSVTLGGFWPSAIPTQGWFVRVRAGGQLSVVGTRYDGAPVEFSAFATVPVDRWFTLELGLHSQHGPGVKRAFAFAIDGVMHGWFRQGRLEGETYDRVAIGVLGLAAAAPIELFVDDWGTAGTAPAPTGPDARSTAPLQTKDFRISGGANWQIDWSTWTNDLRLHPAFGLYSETDRLQSGMNLDRAPSLADGWGEIEIDWPKGRPITTQPSGYFGPMIGFRKEINREQNLEVIPRGNGNGTVDLLLEAWDGNGPVVLAQWPLPVASFGGSSIPEPGDIIRVRWAQATASAVEVRASYYDASAGLWTDNAIAGTFDVGAVNGVDFNDGFHTASSVTIDTAFYSIRRYHAGTLATYPGGPACSVVADPMAVSVPAGGSSGSIAIAADATCGWSASADPWIAIGGAPSGTGDGSVAWTVETNATGVERTGQLQVGGQVVAFTQPADASALPALRVSDASVTEGSGPATTATFTVTLAPASTDAVSVAYVVTPQTAAGGVDFTTASGTVAFAAGEAAKTIAVGITADLLDEPTETFEVTLSAPVGATLADAVGVGTILDDDPMPTLAISDASAGEGTSTAGSATFTVSLSAPSGQSIQVSYATANGTASAGADFVAGAGTVAFAPGTVSLPVTVLLVADAVAEAAETFQVTLSNAVNAAIADATGIGTIADDDTTIGPTTATFAIAAGADDVNDDGASFAAASATVFVGTGAAASYTGLRFTGVLVPRGATVTSARVQVRAPATQWNAMAFEWAAEASGNASPFAAASRPSQRPLGPARVAHSSNAQWVSGTFYTLEEIAPLLQGVVDRADWTSGNAVAVIARGTGGAWGRKFLSAFESGAANAARLVVSYTTPGGPAPPTLSVNDVTQPEGTGANTSAVFTVSLSAASTQTATVAYATANGTATAPADYTSTAGTLTFAPGVTSLTVAVPVIADTTAESAETFALGLSGPTNATLADGTGQATITNDDAAPVPTLSVSDVTQAEGSGANTVVAFTVTLSAASTQTVTVGYATADDTAAAPADYTATAGTLSFAPGVTAQTVSVSVVADAMVEASETFTLGLTGATNATLADGTGQATIINDDAAPLPTLSVSDVTQAEGTGANTTAVFTVTLSAASTQTVTVAYATANGMATAPADYTTTAGTLTFAPGVTAQTVPVAVVADSLVEPAETFTVGLSTPVNATLADPTGQATITNDDAGTGPATLTVQIAAAGDDVNQQGTALAATGATVWVGNGAASVANFTGLRFSGVAIPRNATITAARLEVQAASTQWLSIGFEIGVEAAASSAPFSAAAPPSSRALFAPRVAHASNVQWVANTWYAVGDVTALVQALVNQGGWNPGNAAALVMRGTGGAFGRKVVRSFEGGATTAPRLIVTYVAP